MLRTIDLGYLKTTKLKSVIISPQNSPLKGLSHDIEMLHSLKAFYNGFGCPSYEFMQNMILLSENSQLTLNCFL